MKLKSRGLTSLLLAGTFTLAGLSGIALYLKPKGRVANWTGWTLGGLDKSQWEALHTNSCLLLLFVSAFHLFFNWRTFYSYIKQRTGGLNLKLEMVLAGSLLFTVAVGTVLEVPPFTATAHWGDSIKSYWESSASAGPAPNAEEFTLARFARSIGLSTEELVGVLHQEGLQFSDEQTTIQQLARDNQMSPAEVYTAITKHHSKAIRNSAAKAAEPLKAEP